MMSKRVFWIEQFIRTHWAGLTTRLRSRYWRHVLATCPPDFLAGGPILIKYPEHVSVGREVQFSDGVYINARAPVTFGDRVRLSAFVRINTGALLLDVPPHERLKHSKAPVHIGNDVWLATGVIVNPGVTIHDGVIVGAGAVVTHDLPPYTFCVGVPAKPIRELPRPTSKDAQ